MFDLSYACDESDTVAICCGRTAGVPLAIKYRPSEQRQRPNALLGAYPGNEIQLHAAYSKSSFKRLAKKHTRKEVRRSIEALSERVQKRFADGEDTTSLTVRS